MKKVSFRSKEAGLRISLPRGEKAKARVSMSSVSVDKKAKRTGKREKVVKDLDVRIPGTTLLERKPCTLVDDTSPSPQQKDNAFVLHVSLVSFKCANYILVPPSQVNGEERYRFIAIPKSLLTTREMPHEIIPVKSPWKSEACRVPRR